MFLDVEPLTKSVVVIYGPLKSRANVNVAPSPSVIYLTETLAIAANASPAAFGRKVVNPEEFAAASAPISPMPTIDKTRRPDWGGTVLIIYLGTAGILNVKLASALMAVGRLRRACEPLDEPSWTMALDRCRVRLRISRRVTLLHSDRVSIPKVLGWLRPAVVLPRKRVLTISGKLVAKNLRGPEIRMAVARAL